MSELKQDAKSIEKASKKGEKIRKTARVFGIFAIVIVIFAAIIASFNHKVPNTDKIWDEAMTVGNLEAKNYFIIYSDLMCPYCVAFENAIVENEEEFQRYIEENDILLEVRLSDFLYEYGQSNPPASRYSAEAVYCAKKEGKFWEYYNKAIAGVWNDHFKTSGKSGASEVEKLGKDYWINLAKGTGVSSDFEKCVKNDETVPEIEEIAAKTVQYIDGMPYFKFNSYISSGFDMNWGWEYVKMYFASGLKSAR